MLAFLFVTVTYGRGVDILRMDDRDYLSDGEETDGEAACDSCCEIPEPDTCGDILNKIDEINETIENSCSGIVDLKELTSLDILFQARSQKLMRIG